MDSNFSFCLAFFLLVHMSMGIFTGSRSSDKLTINKIASSSSGEENVEKPDLLKERKRRNTVSVDDVDDQENDAAFPSRPLFVSKGHTGSLNPIAIPLSVDIAKKRKKRDGFSVENVHGLKNDATFLSRPAFASKAHANSDGPLTVAFLGNDIDYAPKTQEKISIASYPHISHEDYNQVAFGSFTNQHSKRRRSRSAQLELNISAKLPLPIFGHHKPPPPLFHFRPRPPNHRPPPLNHRPPPPRPPHSEHNHPPPRYYGPPPRDTNYPNPPPPDTNYPNPPPPDTNIREDYVTDKASTPAIRDVQEDNSTKRSDLNEKIDAIFGTNTTKGPSDISSLIDVRKLD